jgi:hypothetical protein
VKALEGRETNLCLSGQKLKHTCTTMDESNTNYMVKPLGETYAVLDTAANVLVVFNSAVLGKDKAKALAKAYCDMLNELLTL